MELERRADEVEARKQGGRSALHLAAGAVLGGALLAFILQNSQAVQMSWLFFSFSMPLWLMIIIIAVVSVALAKVIGYFYRRTRAKAKDAKELDR